MFDIGFWELTVIAVVALLVIGPERLPRVARTAGLWLGRARRFVSSVKADIDREIAADELKKTLARQAGSEGLYDIIEDTRKTIQDTVHEAAAPKAEAPPKAATDEALTHKSNDAGG
ncbi:MAG TPA: twin-arginine translocase subunit TatB [Gammaproteobacteria bacterium]|nr:twin-arginine translocase subunit TatB [Gammaproteobacteria bacterium]